MKERPILFQGAMVRALLDGSKTQTRRIAKAAIYQDGSECRDTDGWPMRDLSIDGAGELRIACPHGRPDDELWVRENFKPIYPQDPTYNGGQPIAYDYKATYKYGDRLGDSLGIKPKWKPSIHMPRVASRITLKIVSVRVERLQDISEADAIDEGVVLDQTTPPGLLWRMAPGVGDWHSSARGAYRELWKSINGRDSWDLNPWVWAVEFKRINQEKQ